MNSYLYFLILGLVQGITEFLPISSSGHLVLCSHLFGISDSLFVSIVLHFATLLSICVVMRKELLALIKRPFSKDMLGLVLSTIVSVVIVLLLYNFATSAFVNNFLPLSFMLTACILLITDLFYKKQPFKNKLEYKQHVAMGIAQGLAIFPGISRSGSTICAGILTGGNKDRVANQSFLMSIPIIFASMFVELIEVCNVGTGNIQILPLSLGFVVAFISGVLALKFMLKIVNKFKFRYFAIYLFILSVLSFFR